jgi:hypothetical protein
MDVRLPDGTVVTNVPEGITQSELMRRLGKGTPPSQEWMARTMANMTLADKPWYERAAIQMGAGVDNLVTGVKQLLADKDEKKDIEKDVGRMRLLKKAMAESTDTNTLPDWVPTAGSALQTTGEAMPLMAMPVGGYVKGATMLPRAFGLMRSAAAPARLGTGVLAADAAIGGAVSGALNPTAEGESRGMNAAMGAAAGAVTPVVTGGARGVYNMVTPGGGRSRAGAQIANELTEGAADQSAVLQQTIARLRAQQSQPQSPIPLSAAAQLRDPQLARLEAGSRARNGANWYDFDQNQARAVSNAFDQATAEAGDLAARRATREANIQANKAAAFSAADQAAFANQLDGFRNNLQVAMQSAEASNPAVLNMLRSIEGEIERLGPMFGPEHLATIRHNLSGKGNTLSPNAYLSAPRDSVATRSVLQEVDNILNGVTGNKWQNVVSGYAADTRPVDAAKAAGRVREAYYDPTGRVRGVSADPLGDVPKITEAGLGRAMDAARAPNKATLLSDPARTQLESILEALRAQNIVQGVKRSATAGGGSNTASDQFAAKAAGRAGDVIAGMAGGTAGAVTRGTLNAALDWANTHRDRALAEALQNPQRLIEILERRVRAGQPLSTAEQGVLQILRGVPAAAASN